MTSGSSVRGSEPPASETSSRQLTRRRRGSSRYAERPDLAIVDLRLGNASGIDLIRELKRDLPDLMVVLCSGYLSVAAAVAAVRAGADIVVFKPITFREILQRIEESTEEPDLEDTPTLGACRMGAHHARARRLQRQRLDGGSPARDLPKLSAASSPQVRATLVIFGCACTAWWLWVVS